MLPLKTRFGLVLTRKECAPLKSILSDKELLMVPISIVSNT